VDFGLILKAMRFKGSLAKSFLLYNAEVTSSDTPIDPPSISPPDTSYSLRLTSASYFLLSVFLLTLALIGYVWWPLAEEYLALIDWTGPWWLYIDWLLIGIFLAMSILIMIGADVRTDLLIVFVGMVGGLVIESWGTQTEIWTYYTQERPPLWIIPAWPIASLSIDRLLRVLQRLFLMRSERIPYRTLYWILFLGFVGLMFHFVFPTIDKSLTIASLGFVLFLVLTPTDERFAVFTFVAGSALGYFLELWGTTRSCWTYYTQQTPPLFAVLAHGMAAVAFWRVGMVIQLIFQRLRRLIFRRRKLPA
jgi:hypothetical protein